MTLSQYLFELANEQDVSVCGCAVLSPDRVSEPGWTVVTRTDGLRVRIDTTTGAAPAQAAIDAVLNADASDAAVASRQTTDNHATASADIQSSTDSLLLAIRGLALVTMDELNLLRERLTAQDSAVANATSLADLKSRWAAIAQAQPLPDRTASQIYPAIRAKITAGTADAGG